jgi:hypothetical protein
MDNTNKNKLSALKQSISNFKMTVAPVLGGHQESDAWLFRDDIGAPNGIKGYEEQVNSVGMHHGHSHWPSEIGWNTYNS